MNITDVRIDLFNIDQTLEDLSQVDFSNGFNREVAQEMARLIFDRGVGKGEALSAAEMSLASALAGYIMAYELGIKEVVIKRQEADNDNQAIARCNENNLIYFVHENDDFRVASSLYKNDDDVKDDDSKVSDVKKVKISDYRNLLSVIGHELKHALDNNYKDLVYHKDVKFMARGFYHMQVRLMDELAIADNNREFYSACHDAFLFEIGADLAGAEYYKRFKDRFCSFAGSDKETEKNININRERFNDAYSKNLYERALEVIEETKYKNLKAKSFDKLPLNAQMLAVNDFARLVKNELVQNLSKEERSELFSKHPELDFIFKRNGQRKTYFELLGDKDSRMKIYEANAQNNKQKVLGVVEIDDAYNNFLFSDPVFSCCDILLSALRRGEIVDYELNFFTSKFGALGEEFAKSVSKNVTNYISHDPYFKPFVEVNSKFTKDNKILRLDEMIQSGLHFKEFNKLAREIQEECNHGTEFEASKIIF